MLDRDELAEFEELPHPNELLATWFRVFAIMLAGSLSGVLVWSFTASLSVAFLSAVVSVGTAIAMTRLESGFTRRYLALTAKASGGVGGALVLLYIAYSGAIAVFEFCSANSDSLLFGTGIIFLVFGTILLLTRLATGDCQDDPGVTAEVHLPDDQTEMDVSQVVSRKRWPIALRERLWLRHGKKCFYCNLDLPDWRGENMHLDHRRPLADGGEDAEKNLVPSCPKCNLEKGRKRYKEIEG